MAILCHAFPVALPVFQDRRYRFRKGAWQTQSPQPGHCVSKLGQRWLDRCESTANVPLMMALEQPRVRGQLIQPKTRRDQDHLDRLHLAGASV